jgi:seryl-tRNA synthetase
MLDIDLIRKQSDWVRQQLHNLNDAAAVRHLEAVLELDLARRELVPKVQALKEARNEFSNVGRLRGDKSLSDAQRIALVTALNTAILASDFEGAKAYLSGQTPPPATEQSDPKAAFDALFATLKALGDQIGAMDEQIRQIEASLTEHLLWLPNMPHSSVPVALSDSENIPHPVKGQVRQYTFKPKPHWDLGPALDILDFDRGVKLSGTRFYLIKSAGARLYRALVNWMLDEHTARGFQEMYVPFMVKEEALTGSGQFPKFRDVVYYDHESELYMLPTSEVAMANMYSGEILEEALLPISMVAHTPCFRREKMSAGRDVRGIKRVHQFEKVELFKITSPESSYEAQEEILQAAENIADKLQIPHRRLEIVTGDLGFSATKKFDLEMYAPGCEEWLEVSSVSNTEDFQARRANVRYRPTGGGKLRHPHMLNGSGLGMVRALIALMENYQLADGAIVIPEVLRPYMGGMEIIEPKF